MKYKYIVGLLVALSLNNAFAADEDPYQGVYETLTSKKLNASQRINGALDENQTYDNKKDGVLWRSILAGFELRKAVFSLDATELQTIVEGNNAFFKTSLGMSLVYGWTLKHFAAPKLPYYIVGNFSFRQHFNLLADQFTTEQTKTFLKSTFTLGLAAVNADQDTLWEFYSDAISAICVVESISSRHGDLSMDGIIERSYLTKEEAKSEKARVPGRAAHLDDLSTPVETDCEACNFVGLQKYTVANPDHCARIDSNLLATFQSLPADTKEDYVFMRKSLNDHMTYFKLANEVESDPAVMRVPVPLKCQYKGLESVVDVATNITAMVAFRVDTLLPQQFKKILRLAVTENINGIDEHTPGHETLLPYMNYKRDYLGTLDHTDVDLDKLVEEEDLSGFLDTINPGEHNTAKSELVGKPIKELAIALRDELLVADDEKKRAAVEAAAEEEKRVQEITALKDNFKKLKEHFQKSDFQTENYSKNNQNARILILQLRKHGLISESDKRRLAASKAMATLKEANPDENWAMEQEENVIVLEKSKWTFGFGRVTQEMVAKNDREMAPIISRNATKRENNAKKQAKIEAAKFLFNFIKGLKLTD